MLNPAERDLEALTAAIEELRTRLGGVREIGAATLDNIPELRRRLLTTRDEPAHGQVFETQNPLVSVRIATYGRSELLLDRTIPSVLSQTYENLELIVVSDGPDEVTEGRIKALGNSRVRFVSMPHRGLYPTDPMKRWMVAGSPAMNQGAILARGEWIAPLDDDDQFSPDHIEVLLQTAIRGRYEMVYGKFRCHLPEGEVDIGVYPPQRGQFGFQTALYMSRLRFFEWEPRSWLLDEPADWNLCRRMLEAGVRIGFVDRVVTELTPTGPRTE